MERLYVYMEITLLDRKMVNVLLSIYLESTEIIEMQRKEPLEIGIACL